MHSDKSVPYSSFAQYTFVMYHLEEWISLFIFLITAILTGHLASTLRQQAHKATRREYETHMLYDLVRITTHEEDQDRQLKAVVTAIVDVFSDWGVHDCTLVQQDSQGKIHIRASAYQPAEQVTLSADEQAIATWTITHGRSSGLYANTAPALSPSTHFVQHVPVYSGVPGQRKPRSLSFIPLKMGQKVVGVLRLRIRDSIRATSNVPIIILSVKDAEHEKVQALDLGADDYIAKPFGMEEVLARIRVALRHVAQIQTSVEPHVQIGSLHVDFAQRRVQVDGHEVRLTPTEYDILKIFLAHRGKVLTRQMLLSWVWGSEAEMYNKIHSLHVYVAQLRQKIEPLAEHPRFILTVPGVGYRFTDEVEFLSTEGS